MSDPKPQSAPAVPRLVAPTVAVHASFMAAMDEFAAESRAGDNTAIGYDLQTWEPEWRSADGFARYVASLLADALPETPRREGWVPCTTFWFVAGNEYLGRIAVRHVLTDRLREFGGHIGYDVRMSARRRGYATAMLKAVLPESHRLGIEQALITCVVGNVASRKVIEAAGGVLEEPTGDNMLRFWVPTAPKDDNDTSREYRMTAVD